MKHGRSGTPLYELWLRMHRRCTSPKDNRYANYGGRGISVCERWQEFDAFLEDMGERPSSKHSIERKDNDGNYEPGNCVWATASEQARNRRSNRLVTIDGVTKLLIEWAEQSGIDLRMIHARLKLGWPPREAVFNPVGTRSRPKLQGTRHPMAKLTPSQVQEIRRMRREGETLKGIGAKFGITYGAVYSIVAGITWKCLPEEAIQQARRVGK